MALSVESTVNALLDIATRVLVRVMDLAVLSRDRVNIAMVLISVLLESARRGITADQQITDRLVNTTHLVLPTTVPRQIHQIRLVSVRHSR